MEELKTLAFGVLMNCPSLHVLVLLCMYVWMLHAAPVQAQQVLTFSQECPCGTPGLCSGSLRQAALARRPLRDRRPARRRGPANNIIDCMLPVCTFLS